jgi:hypothetical protein
MTVTRDGGCLCGEVRFSAEGEPVNVRICHCRTCQKAMGSPFYARAFFDESALKVTGETGRFASSERLDRVFCTRCGTRLFSWRKDGSGVGVALAPTEHIFVAEKIDWLKCDDGLPQYPERSS